MCVPFDHGCVALRIELLYLYILLFCFVRSVIIFFFNFILDFE